MSLVAPAPTLFHTPPPSWRGYRAALLGGKKRPVAGAPAPALPPLSLELAAQAPDPARLARYRALCGFADAATVPITWPQVLAGSLHLALMAEPSFPFPILGLVHVRNSIAQERPLPAGAQLGLRVRAGEARAAKRGVEFDLHTEALLEGQPAWRAVTTVLAPAAAKGGRGPRPEAPPLRPARARQSVWRVPEDQGRRYAAVSGDYNPIHLSALTARLFGFPRAIVHGMWSLARLAAELHGETVGRGGPWRLDCAFKRPLLLPSSVVSAAAPEAGGLVFELADEASGALLLEGLLAQST